MPKSKYQDIYEDLKEKIEKGIYKKQELLPSENELLIEYDCSRNTVRRAVTDLAQIGYVQAQKGKGVRVIYQPVNHSLFMLGGIETLSEASLRNEFDYETKVRIFSEMIVDKKTAQKTGFETGQEIYFIERIRYINGKPLIIDHSYFLKSIVPQLDKVICEKSIYEYLEKKLKISISTTKRIFSFHLADEKDRELLELEGFNSIVCVSNSTYTKEGIMFEYTQSRHAPKNFQFFETAVR